MQNLRNTTANSPPRPIQFPANSLLRQRLRPVPRLTRQGFPLCSNKRLRPPLLTARASVRDGLPMKGIYLFLSSRKTARNKEKQQKGNQHCFPQATASGRFPHFSAARENAGSSQKRISSLVRSFGSWLPINLKEAVKKSSPGKC